MSSENRKYKDFILRYFKEQGITYTKWSEIQPLYLRYRGRSLKLKPETYEQFKNLCLFESNRHCKYDSKGSLKEGETTGWNKSEEKEQKRKYCGSYYTGQCVKRNYKFNYKDPPNKEDFAVKTEWRDAYQDWSYLKAELADYASVKAVLNAPVNKRKPDLIPNDGGNRKRYHFMFEFPFLIKYAFRCLGGLYPPECFPEVLNDYKEELKDILNKQKEAYERDPIDFNLGTN